MVSKSARVTWSHVRFFVQESGVMIVFAFICQEMYEYMVSCEIWCAGLYIYLIHKVISTRILASEIPGVTAISHTGDILSESSTWSLRVHFWFIVSCVMTCGPLMLAIYHSSYLAAGAGVVFFIEWIFFCLCKKRT